MAVVLFFLTVVKVLILFGYPIDQEIFDHYFEQNHRKLIEQIPNLQASKINHVAGAVTGESPFYCIVELEFNTEKDMRESLNSESGQLMASDFSNFASGGVSVLLCQTTDI
jgi:uncharacterized protein (TIGR02118 family)